ncbi:MAG: MBL fold metallo-hydrolase [Candidatus Tectomicrobia bacterium]|nr:MBL fold metallo-hydrolase [Candidatus Tectomicrobia bacterium]
MKICVLGSGSSGNAIYVEAGQTKILVDAGLAGKTIVERLRKISEKPENLQAIVVSHEHHDHIKGAGILAHKYHLPIYINQETLRASNGLLTQGEEIRDFFTGKPFRIGDLLIEPFSLPHDAADPVGFALYSGNFKAGIVLDLGYPTHLIRERVKGADLLILESNHDVGMLMMGPYPWKLKQRIRSKMGHLSNDDSSFLLRDLLHDKLTHVVLAHLSQTNNHPEIALMTAREVLERGQIDLSVASQDEVGKVIELS